MRLPLSPLLTLWLLLLGALCSPFAAAFSVTFINPGKADEAFWVSVSRSMAAAAADLGVSLEVRYAERDHLRMIELTREVCQRSHKPDYLILVNEKLAAGPMLQLAEAAGVKSFLLLNKLQPEQVTKLGLPRQKLKYWLGSLIPNNFAAGQLTGERLLAEARRLKLHDAQQRLQILAIAGDKATPAGVERLAGFEQAVRQAKDADLKQVVFGEWRRDRSQEQMATLLQRYPQARTVWAANDLMAFGASDAAQAAGRTVGKNWIVSGVNNSDAAITALENGKLAALAAGHFMAGAWGLIMLYDYQHGQDFASEGLELYMPMFSLIEKEQAQRFRERFLGDNLEHVDFRHYSKAANPALQQYQFTLAPLLK